MICLIVCISPLLISYRNSAGVIGHQILKNIEQNMADFPHTPPGVGGVVADP